jgi:hypothetical protein
MQAVSDYLYLLIMNRILPGIAIGKIEQNQQVIRLALDTFWSKRIVVRKKHRHPWSISHHLAMFDW